MSFFVVEQSRDGGYLAVPVPESFDTREAALEALSRAVADGAVTVTGDLFVVDLASALPVLLLPVPPASEPGLQQPEPAAAADVGVSGEPEGLSAPRPDEAWAEAIVAEEVTDEEDSLAAALRRAASSLESEGIVAPESIGPLPVDASEQDAYGPPETVVEPASLTEAQQALSDLVATSAEPPGVSVLSEEAAGALPETLSADAQSPEPEPVSWPWTNVVPVEGVAPSEAALAVGPDEEPSPEERLLTVEDPFGETASTGDADAPVATLTSLDSESAAEVSMLSGVPEGEEAFIPKPVILGDYEDAAAASIVTTAEEPEGAEAAVPGYEAGSELDLAAYTCDDCVYSNTCPKAGESTPAECGSFQWKPE
jgi:hypothetical protein